jgi:ATP-dependent protease HslVU (ClpYQ) peptidase subunit
MTCIVGLEHGGRVYIGADSASVGDNIIRATAVQKVFRRIVPGTEEGILIAAAYSFRVMQVMRFNFESPRLQSDLHSGERYLVTDFIPAMRDCFKEHGIMRRDSGGCEDGSTLLIGFRGELFTIFRDFQVNRYQGDKLLLNNFTAIGSGMMYAIGAMAANQQLEPVERIKNALAIAAHFEPGVCAPYQIEVL